METLQRTANRGSVPTGYEIDNSLKLEADNSEYLSRNPSSDTNRQTFTFSTWVKRTELGQNARLIDVHSDGQNFTTFGFDTNDRIVVYVIDGGVDNGGHYTQRFRDTSAWYHIVWKSDITNATAANRWQIYVNGVEVTGKDIDYGTPPTNFFTLMNTTLSTKVGYNTDGSNGSSQYMAETHLIDGTALAPTEFGEYDEDSGIWKPKAYTGSYGTNGFYLDFESSGSLGADSSGNGNNFTLNNITSADQATDTPTNNFCTLNPLFTGFNSSVQLPSNGATQYGLSGGNQDLSYAGTMGVTKGKWYFENYINEVGATYGARIYVGFHTFQQDYDGVQVGASTNGDALAVWQMDAGNYVAWNGGSRSITSGLGTVGSGGVGKVVGIALNLDDNQISFYYDGSAVTNGTNLPLYNMGSQTDDGIFAIPVVQSKGSVQTANFGGYIPSNFISSAASDANGYGTFEYAPPSGYYALCTKNLAEYG